MLRKTLILLYATGGYVAGLASIVLIVSFLADLPLPWAIDAGAPGAFWPSVAINLALLWGFGLHHSVTARRWFKRRWTRLIPPELERATYLYMTAALTVILVGLWRPIPETVWYVSDPIGAGLLWATYLGVWGLMFSATFPIGHLRFFGLAQAWEKVTDVSAPEAGFTARWLYGVIRHPISLGWMLVPWITPHMTMGQIVFAVGTAVYVLIATIFEEADLLAELEETYREYRRRVPAFFPIRKPRQTPGDRQKSERSTT